MLKTDQPEAELSLFDGERLLERYTWLAHRQLAETIHSTLKSLLERHGKQLNQIQGIVIFKGPGSFTGLRIGVSVANALAYSLPAAIVGSFGDDWSNDGIKKLLNGDDETAIVPDYGALPHITPQKK